MEKTTQNLRGNEILKVMDCILIYFNNDKKTAIHEYCTTRVSHEIK